MGLHPVLRVRLRLLLGGEPGDEGTGPTELANDPGTGLEDAGGVVGGGGGVHVVVHRYLLYLWCI